MKKIGLVFLLVFTGCSGMQSRPSKFQEEGKVIKFQMLNPPLIGTTTLGQRLTLGGFSGLRYLGRDRLGRLRFLTHTDRGPNAPEIEENGQVKRPFLLEKFQPRLVILLADEKTKTLEIEKEIFLRRPDNKPLSGFPQKLGHEVPVDLEGKTLSYDPYGMDLEGVALTDEGKFWMVEEYSPSINQFSAEGKLELSLKPGSGLPKVLERRPANRGFEGVVMVGSRLYAVLQSPLEKKSKVIRFFEVDTLGKRTLGQYAYMLENSEADKIGDLAAIGPKDLLVVERDGKSGKNSFKKVFRAQFQQASNLQLLSEKIVGMQGSLEKMSAEEMAAESIFTAKKTEIVDLASLGVEEEKIEGIDLVEGNWIAVVADNDFNVDGSVDSSSGKVPLNDLKNVLYLIHKDTWKSQIQ